jgi:hypothetical protein
MTLLYTIEYGNGLDNREILYASLSKSSVQNRFQDAKFQIDHRDTSILSLISLSTPSIHEYKIENYVNEIYFKLKPIQFETIEELVLNESCLYAFDVQQHDSTWQKLPLDIDLT